jgi:hypothetical protein
MDKEKKKYANTKGPGSPIETPFKHGDSRIIKHEKDESSDKEVILSDEESLLKK